MSTKWQEVKFVKKHIQVLHCMLLIFAVFAGRCLGLVEGASLNPNYIYPEIEIALAIMFLLFTIIILWIINKLLPKLN